jgi:hypothetical protein
MDHERPCFKIKLPNCKAHDEDVYTDHYQAMTHERPSAILNYDNHYNITKPTKGKNEARHVQLILDPSGLRVQLQLSLDWDELK